MVTIGLIGGLSWYSTAEYYRVINEEVQRRLGGHASAKVALQSLDFAEVFARCHAASSEFRSRLALPPADPCAVLPAAARALR